MNEAIKKVLFGAQKQSLKQNEAIVNFIEDYFCANGVPSVNTEQRAIEAIVDNLNDIIKNVPEKWMIADKLFVEYVLGVNARQAIAAHVPGMIETHSVGENGKVVFSFSPQCAVDTDTWDEDKRKYAAATRCESDSWNDSSKRKALSGEEEAWKLIQEIIDACPPSQRAELPTDDALAAILLSKTYWSAML